ncbi:MAG: TetR/AcrR family transcriptional regulator [Lachnospiraceae bacterium]|nr:TetR/AcrR family transcriptional regulator [Lachnospiraceae bacterium]MBQ9465291.1 TetR/AcrR family transcriptional regulator [Lachnospiraceae bacterium]
MREPAKKIDRRVVKTKKAIHNAFAKLLTEKELNDITISDIAELADINRKTFYNYYAGIYEVVDEIEDGIVQTLRDALDGADIREALKNPYLFFNKLTSIINTDPEFYGHLLSMRGNVSLVTKISAAMKETMRDAVMSQFSAPRGTVDMILDYSLTGMLSVYQNWFNSDRNISIEELSRILSLLCFRGLVGILGDEE